MGHWNAPPTMDDMELEIPRPAEDIVYETSSAWDQHVMEIDYDISQALFLVLDTNFLLKHLGLLTNIADLIVQNEHVLPPLFLVLPGVVVDELDYQSKHGPRDRATAATRWLQEQIEQRLRTGRGALRAQKEDETLRGGKSWRNLRGRGENDNIILDCCLYFLRLSGGQVRLLSQDRNLALKATISDIPSMSISKNMLATEFMRELLPGFHFSTGVPAENIDRSTYASRWASPTQTRNVGRAVIDPFPHVTHQDAMHEDIDMEDMSTSHHSPVNGQLGYRRFAEDPLENFIKNLRHDNVFSRAVGGVTSPESPRQTLSRISKSVPPHILHFVSERGEPGYRAGGLRMWSYGDFVKAVSSLERLFNRMTEWDDEQDEDMKTARKALVSIVNAFRTEAESLRVAQ